MITKLTSQHPILTSCMALSLSRSSYQYHLTVSQVTRQNKEVEDLDLRDKIEKLIKDFPKYGYRPIDKQLRRNNFKINGEFVNHKRILRVMRENSLLCEIKKSFINTTDSNHNFRKYSNLLKTEEIEVTRLDQVWVSDITYIRLPEGFVYLAIILDLFSRKVIGYCLSKHIDTKLVITALEMAIKERKIIDAKRQLTHHSDKGVQYASFEYIDLLKFHGIRVSMSNFGCPWENGVAESFFKTLKTNEVYLNDYQNIYEAKTNLFKFIDDVYNAKRLHSSIGYLPPVEFEQNFKQQIKLKNIKSCDQTARLR